MSDETIVKVVFVGIIILAIVAGIVGSYSGGFQ
jgi:hypothetical protein